MLEIELWLRINVEIRINRPGTLVRTWGTLSVAASRVGQLGEVTSITNQNYTTGGNPPNLASNIVNGPFGPVNYQLGNGLTVNLAYDARGQFYGRFVCIGTTQPVVRGELKSTAPTRNAQVPG